MEIEPTNIDTAFLKNLDFDLAIQAVLLLVLLIYSFFALLFYKQVKILNQSIQTKNARLINILALSHLAYSLLALTVVILAILLNSVIKIR